MGLTATLTSQLSTLTWGILLFSSSLLVLLGIITSAENVILHLVPLLIYIIYMNYMEYKLYNLPLQGVHLLRIVFSDSADTS